MSDGDFDYRMVKDFKRADADWYVEPAWAVELLLAAERFVGDVWDPCAGLGTIVKACQAAGLEAHGSDLYDRSEAILGELDFLSDHGDTADNLIFNPPYNLAQAFIEKALACATHKVAAIVQQQFPFSQRRHAFFEKHPPARIYYLSTRPSMPPGVKVLEGSIKACGGKTDYLWLVWSKDHRGPTQAFWLKRAA